MLKLKVCDLSKRFGVLRVFERINFTLEEGQSVVVAGPNGSGKTTLLHLILGLSIPTGGEVVYSETGKQLDFNDYRKEVSLVAPYLSLYNALTAKENLQFFTRVDGRSVSNDEIDTALYRVGLEGRGGDFISAYSTGMQQRLKYAVALLRKPRVLLIDEPGANLDEPGRKTAYELIQSWRKDSIVVIATNDREEYTLGDRLFQLGS
jgi:heme exporter protein A